MCDWCSKFGDDMDWHFNHTNYARRLYKIRREDTESKAEASPTAGQAGLMTPDETLELIEAKARGDTALHSRLVKEHEEKSWQVHFGQVMTLDEIIRALEFMYPIARMTCGCRRASQGLPDEENFTCIGTGTGMYKWERWPDAYRGGVEFMHPDDAREFLAKLNKKGYVHSIFTFGTPYLGGICNCNYPDCIAIKERLDYGIRSMWKGHYVAKVNPELCTGCGLCTSRCQFRALNIDTSRNVAFIDMFQCFGCGQCVNVCKPEAISLVQRKSLPILANVW